MTATDTPDPAVVAAIARSLGRRGYGWIETVEKIHIIFQEKILNTPIGRAGDCVSFANEIEQKGFTLRTVACIGWAEGHETREEQAAAETRAKLRALKSDIGQSLYEVGKQLHQRVPLWHVRHENRVIASAESLDDATLRRVEYLSHLRASGLPDSGVWIQYPVTSCNEKKTPDLPFLSPEAVTAGASFIAAATVGERLRKAPTSVKYPWTLDTLARAVADASIAWARSTGNCHFCDMNEKDHEQDCVLLPYELAKLDAEDPENKRKA